MEKGSSNLDEERECLRYKLHDAENQAKLEKMQREELMFLIDETERRMNRSLYLETKRWEQYADDLK